MPPHTRRVLLILALVLTILALVPHPLMAPFPLSVLALLVVILALLL